MLGEYSAFPVGQAVTYPHLNWSTPYFQKEIELPRLQLLGVQGLFPA